MNSQFLIPELTLPDDAWIDAFGIAYSAERTTIINAAGLNEVHFSVPNHVTTIEDGAFFCSDLRSISIPQSVTSFTGMAFNNCGLVDVEIEGDKFVFEQGIIYSADRKTIVRYLASNQEANYVIPDTITTIAKGAFSGCTNLKSIIIGNSVTSIESVAFAWCLGLESIQIPPSVTEIPDDAFAMCLKLDVMIYIQSDSTLPPVVTGGPYIKCDRLKENKGFLSKKSHFIWLICISIAIGVVAAFIGIYFGD